MNPRIKELADKAGVFVGDFVGAGMYSIHNQDEVEIFAESLIRECMKIATGLSELYTRDDVGFDVGYAMGTKRVAKEIAESFGIEE